MLNKNTLGIKMCKANKKQCCKLCRYMQFATKNKSLQRPFKLLERHTIVNSIFSQSMIGFVTWLITTVTVMQLK